MENIKLNIKEQENTRLEALITPDFLIEKGGYTADNGLKHFVTNVNGYSVLFPFDMSCVLIQDRIRTDVFVELPKLVYLTQLFGLYSALVDHQTNTHQQQ